MSQAHSTFTDEHFKTLASKTSHVAFVSSGPLSLNEIALLSGFAHAEIIEWSKNYISPWHWLLVLLTKHHMVELDRLESVLLSTGDGGACDLVRQGNRQ